ncbi:porin [Xylophilus sp. ASV27]|uniref:porin n=1 Tax=Xylophilus sp. ASV27 TaxID=2795129 RepID=UPI0018EACF81|nr:porin [Xylophilus sp. ASV27]
MSSPLFPLRAIGLASLLACGVAHAQASGSGVQVYGVIDAAVGSFKDAGGARSSQLSSGNMTTNFFGFKGREDLGGGLYASFTLESYFRGDTGAAGRYNGDGFFSRASNLGLGGQWGQVSLGRVGTPLFLHTLVYNPFGGSFAFSPAIRNTFQSTGRVAGDSAWNNALGYRTPNLHGFTGTLLYGLKESARGPNASAALQYTGKAVSIGLVGQKVEVPFTSGDQTAWQWGGSYDFGPAKVYGQYHRVRTSGTATAAADTRDGIAQLGVSVPAGAGHLLASWSQARTSGALHIERTFATVGYDYRLSRRTDVYAMLMGDRRTAVSSGSTFALGIRHAF